MMNQGTHNITGRHEFYWPAERKIDFVCDWFNVDISLECLFAEYRVPKDQCQIVAIRLGCPKRKVIRAQIARQILFDDQIGEAA